MMYFTNVPRAWSVPNGKLIMPNVDACAVYKFHFQKWSFPDLSASTKPQRKWKLAFQKVQAFKFILQNAASKLRFFQTSIFKFYLLSLLLKTCSTSSFQKLVEKVRNYIKEVWLTLKKWVWRVNFERFFSEKKSVVPRKLSKNKCFFFNRQDEGW